MKAGFLYAHHAQLRISLNYKRKARKNQHLQTVDRNATATLARIYKYQYVAAVENESHLENKLKKPFWGDRVRPLCETYPQAVLLDLQQRGTS